MEGKRLHHTLMWKTKMKIGIQNDQPLLPHLRIIKFIAIFKNKSIIVLSNFFFLRKAFLCSRNPIRRGWQATKDGIYFMFSMLSPSNIKNKIGEMQQMSVVELILGFFKLFFYGFYYAGYSVSRILK